MVLSNHLPWCVSSAWIMSLCKAKQRHRQLCGGNLMRMQYYSIVTSYWYKAQLTVNIYPASTLKYKMAFVLHQLLFENTYMSDSWFNYLWKCDIFTYTWFSQMNKALLRLLLTVWRYSWERDVTTDYLIEVEFVGRINNRQQVRHCRIPGYIHDKTLTLWCLQYDWCLGLQA